MNERLRPPDIDPQSGNRLPLPQRDGLDDDAKRAYDQLADPDGGSLAGLRGPGGIRLHSPSLSACLRPANLYLRDRAGIDPRVAGGRDTDHGAGARLPVRMGRARARGPPGGRAGRRDRDDPYARTP